MRSWIVVFLSKLCNLKDVRFVKIGCNILESTSLLAKLLNLISLILCYDNCISVVDAWFCMTFLDIFFRCSKTIFKLIIQINTIPLIAKILTYYTCNLFSNICGNITKRRIKRIRWIPLVLSQTLMKINGLVMDWHISSETFDGFSSNGNQWIGTFHWSPNYMWF